MATYKATKKGYCGVKVREIGESFDFKGKPGTWMEPIDTEAKEAFELAFPEKSEKTKKEAAPAPKK